MKYNFESTSYIKAIPLNESVTEFEWCPGNGTRYTIAVSKLKGKVSFGSLGSVDGGWLVVEGLYRKAYMFSSEGELHYSYIQEKFSLAFEEDIKFITMLIGFAIERPYIVV